MLTADALGRGREDAAGRVLTVSRAVARARCRRQERLQYGEGLTRIAVEAASDARVRGTAVHAGMAAGILRFPAAPDSDEVRAAVARAADEEGAGANCPEVGAWTSVALRALAAMRPEDWVPARLPADPDGPPLVERRVEVPLRRDDDAAGAPRWAFSLKPDAILVHRPSGRRWGWDHKTHASLSKASAWTELHLQALAYQRALEHLGVRLDGYVLYHVLAAEPREPKLRQDGHLSEAGCVTDWPTACRAIARSADPDPSSTRYDGLRAACVLRAWQDPQEVLSTAAERDLAWEWLLDARDEIEGERARPRRLDRLPGAPTGRGAACQGCDFRDLCAEEFRGGDPTPLLGSAFRRGGDRYLAELAGGAESAAGGLRALREGAYCAATDLRRVARGSEAPP